MDSFSSLPYYLIVMVWNLFALLRYVDLLPDCLGLGVLVVDQFLQVDSLVRSLQQGKVNH